MSDDRKKAEYDRIHRQKMTIVGAMPSLHKESEWCLKYVKEQCFNAKSLYTGQSIVFPFTNVSKDDIFQAQKLLEDAQRALDDPETHPQLGLKWVGEHKSQAYLEIKETRAGLRYARGEVERIHIAGVEKLLGEAWYLYKQLNYDSRQSSTKPRDVFEKLKETQACIGRSYLTKENREILRGKVEELWNKVKEFIGESQRQYEVRQQERAARNALHAEKQAEWRTRQHENIARWRERIGTQEAYIQRLAGQIAENQVRKAGARTSDFAERVQGWIDEKLGRISEVREDIRELRSRIDDVQRRLNES